MSTILLFGFRSPAIEAAKKLGCKIILWNDQALSPKQCQALHHVIIAPYPISSDPIPAEILKQCAKFQFDAVVATTESSVLIAARLRDEFKLTNDSVETALPCFDKLHMKAKAQQAGIPMAPYELISTAHEAHQLIQQWNFPIVVKPRCSSGSRGLAITESEIDLINVLQADYLAEKFIHGIEMSMETFVQNGKILFRNITEYYSRQAVSIIPSLLSPHDRQQAEQFNDAVIHTMQIRDGITHIEMYFTAEGMVLGEIAIRPPGGYLMELLSLSYGFDSWEIYLKIALKIPCELSQKAQQYSAAWIIHPGAGKVSEVDGIDEIKNIPNVARVNCNIKKGSIIRPRIGSGISAGQVVFVSDNRKSLLESLETAQRKLKLNVVNFQL